MTTVKQSEPSEIELLLPWYAAGTLDARGAGAGDPCQRGGGRAIGSRCKSAVRQDRCLAGAKISAIDRSRRSHRRISSVTFAPHRGLVGDGGGARHRAAGGNFGRYRAQGEERGWL